MAKRKIKPVVVDGVVYDGHIDYSLPCKWFDCDETLEHEAICLRYLEGIGGAAECSAQRCPDYCPPDMEKKRDW